jgi:hypothetical protein
MSLGMLALAAFGLSACADKRLTRSGALSSYDRLQRSDGVLTKAGFRVDRNSVLAARTVAILPADLSAPARRGGFSAEQLRLVGNALDRSLCAGLSERLRIAAPGQADLTVQVFVTTMEATDVAAAAISTAAGIGGSVAGAATGLPIRVPRLPIGLGALSVEAQASLRNREQVAAMVWARGADIVTTRARASEEADAYALASEFGEDFARLVVTGEDPIKLSRASIPSVQRIGETLGIKSKDGGCARYGRDPGLVGLAGQMVGLPPKWTDAAPAQ